MSNLPRRTALPVALVSLLLACDGPKDSAEGARAAGDRANAATGGTLVVAGTEPGTVFPPVIINLQGKTITDLVFDHLADIGDSLNTVGDHGFTPRLARSWTWAPDSLSIAFRLDPRARWHDGRPVRAEDVRFTHWAYTNPETASPHGENLRDIDSVTVRDSSTAVFWFKRRFPEQFFEAVYHTSVLPAHRYAGVKGADLAASPAAREPVGTGRFRLARWTTGTALEVVADTANYRGRPKLDRVIWSMATDPTTASTRLFAGDADFHERLGPEMLAQLPAHPDVRLARYPSFDYGYMLFNLADGPSARAHPVLGDRAVRRALTQALDRRAMVRNVWDSLAVPALGPFARAQSAADTAVAQIGFDPGAAARTLDSLGWRDADGDGLRERAGRPLAFSILVPATSAPRNKYAVLIQEQLRRVGAKVAVEQLEFNTLVQRLEAGRFDASIMLATGDPSPATVRQSWSGSAARAKHGSNYGSYVNPGFDAHVDSATAAFDPAAARAHYRAAYATIVADAPAVWLYEPRPMAGVHRRVKVVGMRADGWWTRLAEWSIPPGERIDRDRIGLRTASR